MENLTLVGTVIAVISIIYNILTKLKNAKLTKDLLELEDLFADSRIKNDNLTLLLNKEVTRNKVLNKALDEAGRVELVVEDKPVKASRTKKSK